MSFNLLVLCCLAYAAFLFLIAFAAERPRARAQRPWLKSSAVYTLSLSVYCTAWTFYGAVGFAARSGLEFVTIYTGPTLVFIGWWLVLRKLVRIAKAHHITSIADLISSRYGKSPLLGVIVTVICVIAATPYIALQLQSVALSFSVFAEFSVESGATPDPKTTALWIAAGLALFTVLFGTRNLDASEQHHGVITAIALEAVVKLVALVAVGVFVVWVVADGPSDIFARIEASPLAHWPLAPSRWTGLTLLSAAAILTLPRMFQVMIVETANERHLSTASWAFPLYLGLMSLFVVPIAVVGLSTLPEGSNPDLFVISLPLSMERNDLALLAFLGGFSSATSMVVICAIALATMVSNHIVMPLLLRFSRGETEPGDLRRGVLLARRLSIAGVMGCGYVYYLFSGGSGALAEIGLISFAGVAQMLPALVGVLFWRGATKGGAIAGLIVGVGLWLYTLYLPSFGPNGALSAAVFDQGPFGIDWLRPRALFGLSGMDPLVHAIFWSMALNTLAFCTVSLGTQPSALERLQASQFINVFSHSRRPSTWHLGEVEAEDLLIMCQRILGEDEGLSFFAAEARAQGKEGYLPEVTPAFLAQLERRFSSAIGGTAAHAMLLQITGQAAVVPVEDMLALASETAQIKEYSIRLEAQQAELARTASKLRTANEKLTQISVQKDAFLSQISHELRTPMTSIHAFSQILMSGEAPAPLVRRYVDIIHEESGRLSRLLDDLLDLAVLEAGQVQISFKRVMVSQLLDQAVQSAGLEARGLPLRILRDPSLEQVEITTDPDRLVQVFLNIITNSAKYCDAKTPVLRINLKLRPEALQIDFIDNGSGIPPSAQALIFEKFSRLSDASQAGGAGLGLAICREIMAKLGGSITYLPAQSGAAFRLILPWSRLAA